jgi:hypothetical protein
MNRLLVYLVKVYMYPRSTLLVCFVLIACASCQPSSANSETASRQATAESLLSNPEPLPEFIHYIIGASLDEFPVAQCVMINEAPLWESGFAEDENDKLTNHIMDTLEFSVNGQIVSKDDTNVTRLTSPATPVYDSQRKIIGSYGGPIEACFNANPFGEGLHTATVTLKTLTGKQYFHTWAFKIVK